MGRMSSLLKSVDNVFIFRVCHGIDRKYNSKFRPIAECTNPLHDFITNYIEENKIVGDSTLV